MGDKIKFNDNAENENFYRVQVDQITGVNKSHYLGEKENSDTIILGEQLALYLDLVDPVFGSTDEANEIVTGTPDNEYALFDDTQISGREYTVKVGYLIIITPMIYILQMKTAVAFVNEKSFSTP